MDEQGTGDQGDQKVHVDEDWKKSVADQKARIRDEEQPAQEAQTGPAGNDRALPPPTMETLVAGLYMQTLTALGEIEDPVTEGRERRLPEAGHLIDTIAMLQKKTDGNLTEEEGAYVESALYDLRMRYVRVAAAAGAADAATPADGPAPEDTSAPQDAAEPADD